MTIEYLMAKAHANHSRSPNFQQISAMLSASTISDVETILSSTKYGEMINIVRPSVDLPGFEREMRKNFADQLHRYKRASSSDVADRLEAYSIIIDAENINLIMQAILRNNVTTDLLNIITPVGKFGIAHYERMMGAATVEIASDFIPYPSVRKAVQNALKISDDPDDMAFYISSTLSHSSFSILQSIAPNWNKIQVKFLNLETVCRAITLGVDPKLWMIPDRGVVTRFQTVLSSMKTPREAINYILPHFPIKAPLQLALGADDDDVVAVLEDAALSYLYAQHRQRFYVGGNSNDVILDFFAIKRAELEDISRILFSKIKAIPAEDIRSMLYPIYKR